MQRSQRIYNSKEPTGLVTEGDLLYESGDGFTLQINQEKKEEKKKNQCCEKKEIYTSSIDLNKHILVSLLLRTNCGQFCHQTGVLLG